VITVMDNFVLMDGRFGCSDVVSPLYSLKDPEYACKIVCD
jgi:hypothetical protein